MPELKGKSTIGVGPDIIKYLQEVATQSPSHHVDLPGDVDVC